MTNKVKFLVVNVYLGTIWDQFHSVPLRSRTIMSCMTIIRLTVESGCQTNCLELYVGANCSPCLAVFYHVCSFKRRQNGHQSTLLISTTTSRDGSEGHTETGFNKDCSTVICNKLCLLPPVQVFNCLHLPSSPEPSHRNNHEFPLEPHFTLCCRPAHVKLTLRHYLTVGANKGSMLGILKTRVLHPMLPHKYYIKLMAPMHKLTMSYASKERHVSTSAFSLTNSGRCGPLWRHVKIQLTVDEQ